MTVDVVAEPVANGAPWIQRFPPRDQRALRRHDRAARVRDLVVVTGLAPLWLPLLALAVGLVKLERPRIPAVTRSLRTGIDGGRFEVYELRSTDNEQITRLGRVLRASRLVALPKLFNVLRGEMALVGPRPTGFAADTYHAWHTERLDALPGLTGLWLIAGRGRQSLDDRVRIEIAYLRRRSMWLDAIVLAMTVRRLSRPKR